MRHPVRTLITSLLFFCLIVPVSFFGQTQAPTQKAKKKTHASRKSSSEKVLLMDDGAAQRATTNARRDRKTPSGSRTEADDSDQPARPLTFRATGHPREDRLMRGRSFHGDVRTLPQIPPEKFERPEHEEPPFRPTLAPGTTDPGPGTHTSPLSPVAPPSPSAPAPAPSNSFDGLDFANWGAGHPPDTNGDVGPVYYIQTINTSIGIYTKSTGVRAAAFTFNTLMSQGNFGNLCDTANFGDPVVLYDTFEDRWVITDFAFNLSGGNVVAPQFQCFAVSKSGDPVAGGWNFYSVQVNGGLGDYPKLGIWPDGIYMSANIFTFGAGSVYLNPRVWAFNKAQMYAGATTVQVISFDGPSADFTVLPSNARLQSGTPPAGTPNYFVASEEFLNALTVYKFHVDWNRTSLSTFTGPDTPLASSSWPNSTPPNALSQGGNSLDVLAIRAMVQNQYTNFGGVESLWMAHTVRRGDTSGLAAPRWYQVNVTGGTVNANLPQAATWDPDGANVISRFMPSVAVDRAGNMAMGYSTSSSTTLPAIKYAGRLVGDPINTLTQTEQLLIQGTGTQSGSCGGTCIRWGDYSAMTLDPDGCTLWYTNMYYVTTGLSFNTRIGAFSFPSCTPLGAGGTLQGTVTATVGGAPLQGVTVALGTRSTTTDVNGNYTFTGIPAGTYPSLTASDPGYVSGVATNIVVTDSATTTQNFSLALAATSGCLTDTTQADFQAGTFTNCDLTGSPGDVTLLNAPTVDQQNTAGTTTGTGFGTPSWTGQTFIPAVTGTLVKVEVQLFCSGCTGTTPNLTLSVRATSGGLPTGADLASATITGFNSGAGVYYTATFGSPATLTSGTQYALILRPNTAPSAGGYFWIRSSPSTYANGQRVLSPDSGTTWSADSTRDFNFKAYMRTGYAASGTFVSSVKDANPVSPGGAQWGTISWTADTPANTNVQFQAAASNNSAGPFSFVGPDGTNATFFSNGGSLAQFNGSRYLKYQASLSTTDSTVTATLHDVTICFNNSLPTTLVAAAASGTFNSTANLSATLTSSSVGVSGKTVTFTLNGNAAGSGTTDSNGVATVSAASLTGINAGSYPTGVSASFAGDSTYSASSGTAALTVSKANQTITFGALGSKTFGDPDFGVSATASSTLTVTFGASGNCSVTGSTVHITGAGSCTITASQAGDSNYNAATDVPQSFSIAKSNQTITFGALGGKTFGDPDFGVSATASSTLTVTFGASGNCSVTGSTVHITGAGSCTITASQAGDSNYNAASDVPQSFSIAKSNQTITFGALAGHTFGDPDFSVSATASSTLVVTFGASGNCTVTGSTVHITGAGSCTVTASQAGNVNFNAATDVPQSFSIAKANQTITFGALAGHTFGDPDFSVSASASSSLTVTFGASGNCTVTGSTVHITGAGSCTITASQTGNSNFNAATDVPQSFSIAKSNQTITFGALAGKTFGNADFAASATASSTLAVSFGASGNCTVTGSTVHITVAGSCTITASQAGDSNFNAATNVPQTFAIAKATPTVTVTCPAGVIYDGAAHACTAAAIGIGSVTVTGTQAITYNGNAAAPSAQGNYAVSDSFTSSDANYNNATGTGSLTIAALTPTVANMSPIVLPQNSAAFTLTVNGTNFVPGTVVNWNGSARVTTFVGPTQVKAAILATDLTTVGTAVVTVFNPTPGGGTSSAFTFAVDTPAGTAGAVTASSGTSTLTVTHGQSTTLTVTFTGETTGATVTAACFNLPAGTTCTLSGATVTITTSASTPAGSYQVIVVFTVTQTTTASLTGQSKMLLASGVGLMGLPVALLWMRRGQKKRLHRVVLAFLGLALLLGALTGCGGHATTLGHSVTSQSSVSVTLNVI
jgi:carboxypeptidase family protein